MVCLPYVWQGPDHTSPPESDLRKITGRLNWLFAKSSIGGVEFPVTCFYIVWEIPLAGSEMATAFEPVAKKEQVSGETFINEFQSFMNTFKVKS